MLSWVQKRGKGWFCRDREVLGAGKPALPAPADLVVTFVNVPWVLEGTLVPKKSQHSAAGFRHEQRPAEHPKLMPAFRVQLCSASMSSSRGAGLTLAGQGAGQPLLQTFQSSG